MNLSPRALEQGGFLAHELAFLLFLGVTAVRLFLSCGLACASAPLFAGLAMVPVGLFLWCRKRPTEFRWRVRLLAYLPLMAVSYAALKTAVPLLQNNGAAWLQQMDGMIIGGNASVRLENLVHPVLTELFSFLYIAFFSYLAWSLWDYGRGNLALLQRFIAGLFTVYGLGFFGYTLVPAAGPYLEMAGQFRLPLAGGWFTHLNEAMIHWGSNRTDCFPCLHFAVSCFILMFDFQHRRRRFRWMLLPCAGIWVSTVYLRQHYLVDLLAGVALVVLALGLARKSGAAVARRIEPSGAA